MTIHSTHFNSQNVGILQTPTNRQIYPQGGIMCSLQGWCSEVRCRDEPMPQNTDTKATGFLLALARVT